MIAGRGPFRRRVLVMDALIAGEPATDDFLRCELSRTIGELVLDTLEWLADALLTVRSRAGAAGVAGVNVEAGKLSASSCVNKGNQGSACTRLSLLNMGDVSKLSVISKGDASISGEVMLVNVVEGGADCSGSMNRSLGDTVRVDPATEGLIAVKAEAGASQEDMSDWRAAKRLAPESNELLLFKSATEVSLSTRGAGQK